jgi:hypothetical protein
MRQGKGKSRIPSGIEGWAGFLSLAFFWARGFSSVFSLASPLTDLANRNLVIAESSS